MSRETADPRSAALHLMEKLDARPGDLTISTFRLKDDVVLRVFLPPSSRYQKRDIPAFCDGYKVLCEIAEPPKAGGYHRV